MSASTTIIAALKFEGGVVIAADSQTSDPSASVRWPVEKLHQVGAHPLVVGIAGATGSAKRVKENLDKAKIHSNMFDKQERVRDLLDRCFDPVYQRAFKKNSPPPPQSVAWQITIHGLAAFWADGVPRIIEYETNSDCDYHDYFHAIGSGSGTAYAIWRTLGSRALSTLDEAKAIPVTLRILRTCVNVEMWGVSEPFSIWLVTSDGARKLSQPRLEADLQYVDEWEESERQRFFKS
ncbi:MAG: hypothetical protein ACC700_17275 [Anaerolineales bacterium]